MTREDRAAGWRKIVEKQAESGMSAAAFCREHHVNVHRFYSWRRRFNHQATTDQTKGFFELVPVSERREQGGILIHLGNNLSIEIHPGFDPSTLRLAMETLSRAQ